MISNCYSAYDIEFMKQIAAEKLGSAIENVAYKVSSFYVSNKELHFKLSDDCVHFLIDYEVRGDVRKLRNVYNKNQTLLTLMPKSENNIGFFSEINRLGKFIPISGGYVENLPDNSNEDNSQIFFYFLSFYAGF